jgi:hypothetical protein
MNSSLPGQSFAMQLAAKNKQGTARSSFPPVELPFGSPATTGARTSPIEGEKESAKDAVAVAKTEPAAALLTRDSSGDAAKPLGAIPRPPRVPSGLSPAVKVPVREEVSHPSVGQVKPPTSVPRPSASVAASSVKRPVREDNSQVKVPLSQRASQVPTRTSQPSIPPSANAPPSAQVLRVDEIATKLPLVERDALRAGDVEAIDTWMRSEVPTGVRERMGPRIQAILALAHGEQGQALNSLREACKPQPGLTPIEQSRNHLAYAIALAQTQRTLEALVEALEALARAREARDSVGEKACLVFLQKLYAGVGHGEAGELWTHARTIGVRSGK